jgi:hypothetical protein
MAIPKKNFPRTFGNNVQPQKPLTEKPPGRFCGTITVYQETEVWLRDRPRYDIELSVCCTCWRYGCEPAWILNGFWSGKDSQTVVTLFLNRVIRFSSKCDRECNVERLSRAWKIVKAWCRISKNRKPSNALSVEVTYLLIPSSIKLSHGYIIISSKLQSICRSLVPARLIRSEDAASHLPFGATIRRPDHSEPQGLLWGSIPRRFIFPLLYSTNVLCHLDDLDASINITLFGLFATSWADLHDDWDFRSKCLHGIWVR